MSWLDEVVGWVSPGAGLRRARARAALAVVRSYEGAKVGRRTSAWSAPSTSANAELFTAIERLRNRSRDLVRNNPYARRAVSALVANAIGTGIRCGAKGIPGSVWAAWGSEADFYGEQDIYGLQAMLARGAFESGEALIVRMRTSSAAAGASGVPLKLKILEGDYIASIRHGPMPNGNFAVSGVEIDPQGRKVAYWLYPQHPGDFPIFTPRLYPVRVLAEDVIHLFEKERPGQLRGVPRLASSILKLRDLDEYQDAMLVKKKIEACFAAFITTDEDDRGIGTKTTDEAPDDDGNVRRLETMSPGMIERLKTGESITFGNPSSTAGENAYTRDQLLAIAMGAGITYEQLTGDLSNANFSQARMGRQEFKALIEQFRWLCFIPMALERVWGWFEEAAFQAGKIRTRGYEHVWTPPRWEYVNPLDDVRAEKEELAAGLASLSEKLRERGVDPDANFGEIAKERKELAKLGVTVDYGIKGSGVGDVTGADAGGEDPGGGKTAPAARISTEAPPERGASHFRRSRMDEPIKRELGELPLQTRFAPIATVDVKDRTAQLVWTRQGAQVKRYDWRMDRYYMEELSLDASAVRMGRLQSGSAPFLRDHGYFEGIEAQIGVVSSAALGAGEGTATVRFSKRDEVTPIFNDVADGILRNVSVGYVVYRYEMLPPADGSDVWIYRATDWEPMEISLVAIPADPGAGVRDAKPDAATPCFRCEFITPAAAAGSSSSSQRNEETTMTEQVKPTVPAADPNAGNEAALAKAREEAAVAERARVTEIQTRARTSGATEEFTKPFIEGGKSVDEFCRALVDEMAKKSGEAAKINGARAEVVEDERIKLRAAVSEALVHRVNPKGELKLGGDFRYMSLLRVAEEVLTRENVRVRGMPAMEIAARAMQSTSDFANILADAFNKRLRQQYIENEPSYTVWARRAPNAPDFKTINVIQLSNAPDLKQVLEGGEFKRGSLSDGKETYSVTTYGRIIPITRQALINDDLNAFDRTPRLLAAAGRRLENRTVYGVLVNNGNMSDSVAVFATGHSNLATGTGSALSATSMITARAGIRTQKGKQSEELNLAPRYLLVPAALEQTAYQLTSNQYTPTKPSDINEFRTGGRTAVQPIVEAYLDGQSGGTTKWWLLADTAQIDTVEYCYLDGNEGLYLESQIGFDTDGIELKARLDFAAAPIDYRGMYQSNGV